MKILIPSLSELKSIITPPSDLNLTVKFEITTTPVYPRPKP